MKIMVVDDNEYILELIKHMLKSEPFELSFCRTVDQAVSMFESGADIGLVITDIIMPEKDGTQLMQYIKDRDASIPVLAITGGLENAQDDYMNYAEMFADDAMAKPFKKEDLLGKIRDMTASTAVH